MPINLDVFEVNFEDDLILKGEKLRDSRAIVDYTEIEKNLWTLYVKDEKLYEVEILLAGKKIRSYSCDCQVFASKKICPHIIASFHLLRHLKTRVPKKLETPKEFRPKVLSVNHILKEISHEELINFVRSYASKDAKLNLALKAGFARKINLESNEGKYRQVLDMVIKPARNADYTISNQATLQYLRLAEDYLEQFKDSVSIHQYLEAFYILKALLAKNAYALHYLKTRSEKLEKFDLECHESLEALLKISIAPELKLSIFEMMLELGSRSYYWMNDIDLNAFNLALIYFTDAESIGKIIFALLDKLEKSRDLGSVRSMIWTLLLLHSKMSQIQGFIKDTYLPLELKIQAIHLIIEKNNTVLAESIILKMEELNPKLLQRTMWNELRLELAKKQKNQSQIDKCAESLLFILFQHKYFQIIQSKRRKTAIKKNLELSSSLMARELLYQIYLEEENRDALKTLLISTTDLDSLIFYSESIQSIFEDGGMDLFTAFTSHMLENYIGTQANDKTKQILRHLRSQGLDAIEKKILKLIKADFSQRTSLLKDLSLG